MSDQLPAPVTETSRLSRLGLVGGPSKAAPYLRAILTFITQAGEEQIKQIPVVGPLLAGASAALIELSAEEDDRKLEERVEKILDIGTQTHEEIVLLTGLAGLIFLQQGEIIRRLEAAGLQASPQQLTEFATGAALVAYRGRVANDYHYVDIRGIEGITGSRHAASLPLEEIYIVPRLMPEGERERAREREKSILKALVDDHGDLSSHERIRLEEEYAVITGERWSPGRKSQEEGTALGKALSQARHTVIIGGPGVGKSAMTRYVARLYALGAYAVEMRLGYSEQLTPVVVPLAAFADERSRRPGLNLRAFLDQRLTARGGDALRAAITHELSRGRVFLLLDGVDEVPESHARAAVVRAVDEFIADHSANRIVVTSRPYGYVRLAGDISHFQLLNFSPTQVEEFVRRWQCAFERRQHPDAPNMKDAGEEADALIKEIHRSPKVTELATNPLMLVIISLIRYERARLPEERVQLYNRAVNTLMDTWNQWRSLPGKDVGGLTLPLDRLTRVWGAVAEWMRRTKPTGVVHRAELKRELMRVLKEKEYDEDTPDATAESYLKAAADRAGLLEERGFEIFAFWHPTFEEFLAAVELSTPTSKAVDELLKHRDDPRWREVILLAVGYVGIVQRDNETATQIVKALAYDDPGPEEPIIHAHLRLAAACVADDVGVKRTLSQRIIVDLARIIQEQPYYQLQEVFTQTVRALPNLRARPETISDLAPLATYPSWRVRMEAARVFSNVAADNQDARKLCEQMFGDTDGDVRCHAALGLARAGDKRPEVWQGLLPFNNGVTNVEAAVREFFKGDLATVVSVFKSFLSSDDHDLRRQAVSALHALGHNDEEMAEALKPLLSDENLDERLLAASLLVDIGAADEDVIEGLRSFLTPELSARKVYLIREAVSALKRIDRIDGQVADALTGLFRAGGDTARFYASLALRDTGPVDEQVVRPLLLELEADNLQTRYRVASSLIRLGRGDDEIISALKSCLATEDNKLRLSAAQSLIALGHQSGEVTDSLLLALESNDQQIRYFAAAELVKVGNTGQKVADVLLSMLESDLYGYGYEAIFLIKDIPQAIERAAVILTAEISSTDSERRSTVAMLLAEIGREEQALETVAKTADSQPWAALSAFQKILRKQPLTHEDGAAIAALTRILDRDDEIQREARSWLFDWLWQRLEPVEESTAGEVRVGGKEGY